MTPNDYLCSYSFTPQEIFQMINGCLASEKSAKYKLKGQSRNDGKFEVVTRKNPNKPDCSNSRILMSMELLTEEE